jgi:type IV secretory pathway TrbL component
MRKSLRVVALSVPLFLIAPNSYAGVKAGSACSKLGMKSVSAGKTYICLKNGKKLAWSKGVIAPASDQSSNTQSTNKTISQSEQATSQESVAEVPENLKVSEDEDSINLSWSAPRFSNI